MYNLNEWSNATVQPLFSSNFVCSHFILIHVHIPTPHVIKQQQPVRTQGV